MTSRNHDLQKVTSTPLMLMLTYGSAACFPKRIVNPHTATEEEVLRRKPKPNTPKLRGTGRSAVWRERLRELDWSSFKTQR